MRLFTGVALAALMLSSAPAAMAQTTLGMEQRFGLREAVAHASLSPDGKWIATVQPDTGRGAALMVAALDSGGKLQFRRVTAADGKPQRIEDCRWTSNIRLLCTVSANVPLAGGERATVTRFVAIDRDGANQQLLQTPKGMGNALNYTLFGGSIVDLSPGEEGHVLMARRYVPEESVGTRAAQTRDGLGIDDIDTATLKARIVEPANRNAGWYISDGAGTVRVMATRRQDGEGYLKTDENDYVYRRKSDRSWLPMPGTGGVEGFDPEAIDAKADIAYGLMRRDGRVAAYSYALDGSAKITPVYAHPQVDVDGFVRIGRNRRPVGVSYATDKREAVYFDPALAKLASSLGKALSGKAIRFVDSSQDEQRLLIWAGSDLDPGAFYLFDRASNTLDLLFAARPELADVPLAAVQPVTYKAADGTMIPAYLTLPPSGARKGLPAIVLPHGGPSARDEWGFDWLSQYLAGQGYAVLQPNFRGSSGYGDVFFQKNGFQNWRTAIGDIDDGGRWLIEQGIADADRLAIVGWSYGGYAALQSAATEPGLFRAVAAIAPVTDLGRLKEDHRNWSDFRLVSRFVGSGPHVEEGSPARQAAKIKVPVLLFHGSDDRNVEYGQSRLMEERLKAAGAKAELVRYDGLDHYLDDSIARADMLTRLRDFLKASLPPQ
jgi:dipeptidyl aminopeptidase/acylaminoacyl peptidase